MRYINFDYTFVLEKNVGKNGLNINDIKGYGKLTKQAIENIENAHREGELDFLNLPENNKVIEEIEDFVKNFEQEYDNILVLGIGGSSLGFQAIFSSLFPYYRDLLNGPKVYFLENVDSEVLYEFYKKINLKRSIAIIITKSGCTAETMAHFMILKQKMDKSLGDKSRKRIITITDPEKGDLLKISKEEGYKTFYIPSSVGGRFSVLTPVGLLPSAMAGISARGILKGAKAISKIITSTDVLKNPSALGASILIEFYKRGRNIFVLFPYSSKLLFLSHWFRQLWAESLGKEYDLQDKKIKWGQTPVTSIGTIDQHSQLQLYMEGPDDKIIGFISVKNKKYRIKIPEILDNYSATSYLRGHQVSELLDSAKKGTEYALANNGKPSFSYIFDRISPATIGAFFLMMEMQTSIAGEMLRLNPYNQPGVETSKRLAYGFLGRKNYNLSEIEKLLNIKRNIV